MRLVLTLLVTLAVAGAPVAVEACQTVCAEAEHRVNDEAPSAARHACHASASAEVAVSTLAAVHVCGHASQLPVALQSALLVLDLAAPAEFIVVPVASVRQLSWHRASADPSPPDRFARTAALRI